MNDEFDNSENAKSESTTEDHALDEAMRLWGDERTADPKHLDEQRADVISFFNDQSATRPLAILTTDENAGQNNLVEPHGTWIARGKWWIGVAALLLVAAGIGLAKLKPVPENTIATPIINKTADNAMELAEANFEHQRTLLSRFQEVFGAEIRCVAEVDGNVEVQLKDESSAPTPSPEFLSVRLVLISRNASTPGSWRLVRDINLLTDREQRIELPSTEADFECSVWVFPVGEDLVSIDLNCRMAGTHAIEVSTSELQKSGEAEQVYSATKDGIEYRLYQTAIRMDQRPSQSGTGAAS